MSCIEISTGTPEETASTIRDAIDNKQDATQIRLFQVTVSNLGAEQTELLEQLVKSRAWERVVISFCSGRLSEKAIRGLLQTKRLELYGDSLGLLEAHAKEDSPTIEVIFLRTRFNHSSIEPLQEILAKNHGLHYLNLSCRFSDSESMFSLGAGLEKNRHLKVLTFYGCDMFDESSTEALLRSLVNHASLSTLALQDNNFFGMAAIVDLVSQTQALQNLQLYHPPLEINEIQVPQVNVETLSIALKQNKSLKSLDLSNNGLHDGSAMCLAVALRFNQTLGSLNVQGNMITDKGAMSIGKALPDMKGLKELYLWNNKFNGVGARALLVGLKKNEVLETLTTYSSFRVSKELQFYTRLNKAGRRILKDPNSIPMNVWPLVLERVNDQDWEEFQKTSVVYALLREGPAVIAT